VHILLRDCWHSSFGKIKSVFEVDLKSFEILISSWHNSLKRYSPGRKSDAAGDLMEHRRDKDEAEDDMRACSSAVT
jgi:hypothetical protein